MTSTKKRERMEQTSHKVIEKRRRDRINNCLFELSQTVPAAFSKQTSGKLEKAEILEMTVEYLRVVQTTDIGMRFDKGEWFSTDIWGDFAHHYQTGYGECVREVVKYMADVEGISLSDSRCARLVAFLHNRFRSDLTGTGSGSGLLNGSGGILTLGTGSASLPPGNGRFSRDGAPPSCIDSFVNSNSEVKVSSWAGVTTPGTSREVLGALNAAVKTVPPSAACEELPPALSRAGGGSCPPDTARFVQPLMPTYLSPISSRGELQLHYSFHPQTTSSGSSASSFSSLVLAPSTPFRSLPHLSVPTVDFSVRCPPDLQHARDTSASSAFITPKSSRGFKAGDATMDFQTQPFILPVSAGSAVRTNPCYSV